MARVRVDDQTWREFRQSVGAKPIAERLGELVAREAAAHRRHQLRTDELGARAVLDALERAEQLNGELAAITGRLELLRNVPPGGVRATTRPERPAGYRPIPVEEGGLGVDLGDPTLWVKP